MLVDTIECDDDATSVCLAEGDLQDQNWNSEEEKGNEVGDEPLQAIVRKDNGRIPQEISQANSTALLSVA